MSELEKSVATQRAIVKRFVRRLSLLSLGHGKVVRKDGSRRSQGALPVFTKETNLRQVNGI
jgi:hypothetical protein